MSGTDHIGASDMDIFRSVFGVVHGLGKGALNVLNMGGVASGLEKVETAAGLLPSFEQDAAAAGAEQAPSAQAPSAPPVPVAPSSPPGAPPGIVVTNPDAVVLIRNLREGRRASGTRGLRQVVVQGGARFRGNDYKKGDPIGQSFSFGVDKPARVEVTDAKGRRFLASAQQVLFLGGTESTPVVGAVHGDVMSQRDDEIGLIESQLVGGPFSIPDFKAQEYRVTARPQDLTQTSTYKTAQANLVASQARQADAMARLQRAKSPRGFTPTAVSIPSFSLAMPPDLSASAPSLPAVSPPSISVETAPGSAPPGSPTDSRPIDWGSATQPGDWVPNMDDQQQNPGVVGSAPGWVEINDRVGDDVLHQEVLGELEAIVGAEGIPGRRRHKNLCPVVCCPHCAAGLCVVQAEPPGAVEPDVVGALAVLRSRAQQSGGAVPAKKLLRKGDRLSGACPNCGTRLDLTFGATAPRAEVAPTPVSAYEHGSAVLGSDYVGVDGYYVGAAPAGTKPGAKGKPGAVTAKPGAKGRFSPVRTRAAGRSKTRSLHRAAIARTENVIKYAENRAKKTAKKADAYKPKDHKTIIPVKLGDVKGQTILGADKVMTPKQQQAVQKHTNALVVHHKAVQHAKGTVGRAHAAISQAKDALKKARPEIAKLSKKGMLKNRILGGDDGFKEVVGDLSEADQRTIDKWIMILRAKGFQYTGDWALENELAKVNIYPDTISPDGAKIFQRIRMGLYGGASGIIGDDGFKEIVSGLKVVGDDGFEEVAGGPGFEEVAGEIESVLGVAKTRDLRGDGLGAVDSDDKEVANLLEVLDYIDDLIGDEPPPAGDPSASAGAGADSDVTFEDAGDIPLPARGEKLSPEEAKTVYWGKSDLPEDAVFYQGDRGILNNALGSWNTFYGKNPNGDGFSDGWLNGVSTAQDTGWSAGDVFATIFTGGMYAAAKAAKEAKASRESEGIVRWVYRAPDTNKPDQFMTPPDEFTNNVKGIAKNSIDRGWGPMIGNPNGDLAGLQFCMETADWFWQGKNAPVWATAVADAKITELNKKTAEAKRAAEEVEAAAKAQEQAAQEEEKAKQDAANALAQSVADTQANIARQAQEAQSAQQALQQKQQEAVTTAAQAQAAIVQQQQQTAADVAARKYEQELAALQAKTEAELFRTYQQQDAEQQKLDLEAQRATLEWAKTQPVQEPSGEGSEGESEGEGIDVDYGDSERGGR